MDISGNTNSSLMLGNDQFVKSGDTVSTPNSVSVTDENGMDISQCFGINSDIVEDVDDLSEDCESILEIKITRGVIDIVDCPTSFTQQTSDGLILAEYSDGSVNLNVHPECCEALSFTSEIGVDGYYVCRWKIILDPEDCDNYLPKSEFDSNGYKVFTFDNLETNIVPSVDCCYLHGLTEEVINGEIHCIEIPLPVCSRYTVIEPTASFGHVEFLDTETSEVVTLLPTLDCCTVNGLSYTETTGGFNCYNAQNPPTVQVTLGSLCCEDVEPPPPTTLRDFPLSVSSGEASHACIVELDGTYYHDGSGTTPVVGNRIYEDIDGLIPFFGQEEYFNIYNFVVIQIDYDGFVTAKFDCDDF